MFYKVLDGVKVWSSAILSPDFLCQILADLGAEVIKLKNLAAMKSGNRNRFGDIAGPERSGSFSI